MNKYKFGDVLKLISPTFPYSTIRIMYISEAQPTPPDTDHIVNGVYVADNASRPTWVGRISTFYHASYQLVDE